MRLRQLKLDQENEELVGEQNAKADEEAPLMTAGKSFTAMSMRRTITTMLDLESRPGAGEAEGQKGMLVAAATATALHAENSIMAKELEDSGWMRCSEYRAQRC